MVARMDHGRLMVPRRVRLLDAMHARPGQGFRELARNVGIATGCASHHLAVLERHDEAWSIGHGPRRRFFVGSRPRDDDAQAQARAAGMDAGMTSILAFVQANPGCIQRDVKHAFGTKPRSTVQHILGRLERECFLQRMLSGRCVRYYPTAQGVAQALVCPSPAMTSNAIGMAPAEVSA